MRPSASTEEVRAAYRALAQRLHPDRQAGASPAERALAERRMREINEAWDVLRDPDRRRAYDAERLAAARGPRTTSGPPGGPGGRPRATRPPSDDDRWEEEGGLDLIDVGPEVIGLRGAIVRHLPWVAILAVLGVIFVATAYAGSGASSPTPTTQVLGPGTCVDVATGPVATVVSCDGPHELEIVARITEAQVCPAGTERRRLTTDGLLDCVVAGST